MAKSRDQGGGKVVELKPKKRPKRRSPAKPKRVASGGGRPKYDWNRAFAVYLSLEPTERDFKVIADMLGANYDVVRRHAKKEGWEERAAAIDAELATQLIREGVVPERKERIRELLQLAYMVTRQLRLDVQAGRVKPQLDNLAPIFKLAELVQGHATERFEHEVFAEVVALEDAELEAELARIREVNERTLAPRRRFLDGAREIPAVIDGGSAGEPDAGEAERELIGTPSRSRSDSRDARPPTREEEEASLPDAPPPPSRQARGGEPNIALLDAQSSGEPEQPTRGAGADRPKRPPSPHSGPDHRRGK